MNKKMALKILTLPVMIIASSFLLLAGFVPFPDLTRVHVAGISSAILVVWVWTSWLMKKP